MRIQIVTTMDDDAEASSLLLSGTQTQVLETHNMQGSGRRFGYASKGALLMLGVLSACAVSHIVHSNAPKVSSSETQEAITAYGAVPGTAQATMPVAAPVAGQAVPPAAPVYSQAVPAPAPATAYAGAPAAASAGCFDKGGHSYSLDWKAEGPSFFNEWNFMTNDVNFGAAQYATREQAVQQGVIDSTSRAIFRAGPKGNHLKRWSAKMVTQRKWKYFLMAVQLNHIPWGCGIWPALWTRSPDVGWPNGGELDIIETTNDEPSRSSFHVGIPNRCKLDPNQLRKPGCPQFIDAEYNFTGHYDCVTNYPTQIGCAPNILPLLTGQQLSTPSVMAVEWTEGYLKIFRIPVQEIPPDLTSDSPQPDGWDRWIIAYYPFAASERAVPGSCPNPANIMAAQQIVLNLGFCGDWASKVWVNSTMCANRVGMNPTVATPHMPDQCVAVDPHNPKGEQVAGPRDCCTQYIYDEYGTYNIEETLRAQAYFDISWLKVYQQYAR